MKTMTASRRRARRAASPVTPRIYGDGERFKANVTQHIARGEHLLDELEGVRRSAAEPKRKNASESVEREAITLMGYHRLWQWTQRVGRWRMTVLNFAERQLADQSERLLPRLSSGLPHPTLGIVRTDDTPRVERWLREAVRELASLRASLGIRRNVAVATAGRFDELRASGLIDAAVIDGWAKDVAQPRTPKQLSDAIGAAKEIAEASLRSGLDRLNVSWGDRDGLQQLMKKWRAAARPIALDASGAQQLDRALAALGNLLAFLAEWRNAYGRGHGRPRYATGLRAHHARLAVDVADAVARFVVLTMDDLERLPPK